MKELPPNLTRIHDPFWDARLDINAHRAIFHQWEMLEASGCIDNFRIAAGEKVGLREGWFFADSDATKWLDAAARIERNQHDPELCNLMDTLVALLEKAQTADGYLFTYNQIHFPGQRWVNLQIEHELYCHGHLIEAGVSHYLATGQERMLKVARKAADLLVSRFLPAGPKFTPGHEEIELALLRLWQVSGEESYRCLAEHFIELRGRQPLFGLSLVGQFASNAKRESAVAQARLGYFASRSEPEVSRVPAMNKAIEPRFSQLRFFVSGLSGKYFQQHRPIRQQLVPVGHAVRMGYLNTAVAMLLNSKEPQADEALLQMLQASWERMVTRRMDVTGGLGALPVSEAFGNDFELNPETAYNETCAALASLFWNWQMLLLTGQQKYTDLFEWQLYNAAAVGMGFQGDAYLYNNPTLCHGGILRQPWYSIPCCPSNLSRTYADLGKYIATFGEGEVWLHQYIGSEISFEPSGQMHLSIRSELPWEGRVKISLGLEQAQELTLHLRLPAWAGKSRMWINGEEQEMPLYRKVRFDPTATGYDPRLAFDLPVTRLWQPGDEIKLDFEMPVRVLHPHEKTKALKGLVAIHRGPLVYCLESIDNPHVDIFTQSIRPEAVFTKEQSDLFGGIVLLKVRAVSGQMLTFIPYSLWGNRGESKMSVWVKKTRED